MLKKNSLSCTAGPAGPCTAGVPPARPVCTAGVPPARRAQRDSAVPLSLRERADGRTRPRGEGKNVAIKLNLQILLIALASIAFPLRAEDPAPPKSHKLDIRPVDEKDWKADIENVHAVLLSAASELWKYFPERTLPPIEVSPRGGPITLFQRGPNGEIRVKLDTGGYLWAQYSFQFAHEMCHILCDFKPHENPNHWFEESLCEAASVFALRHMAETWKTKPPYGNWKDYAKHLREYADDRTKLAQVPDGKTFLDWFQENEPDLRLKSTDRARNNIVAGVLVPLLEAEPKMWEAVTYLNTEKLNKSYSFKQYLEAWRRNSQEKHRAFIDKIAKQFGLELK